MAHILLVLTDKLFSSRIAEFLKPEGHTIDQCHSYLNAINQYTHAEKVNPYQGIIIDHHLPEIEIGRFINQANSLNLVREIFKWTIEKIKKSKRLKRSVFFYPKPWLILLSSHPHPVTTTYEFFNLETPALIVRKQSNPLQRELKKQFEDFIQNIKKKSKLRQKTLKKAMDTPIHIIHKGRGMENMLIARVAELELRYCKCIYNRLIFSMVCPVLGAAYIIFQNFMKPITLATFFYAITIIVILLLFYYIRIRPGQPYRAVVNRKTNNA